jgi:protein TonB
MKWHWLALFLLSFTSLAQQISHEIVFLRVEDPPQFIGGQDSLLNFLKQNLQYPEEARKAQVVGKVELQFIVEKDGTVSNVEVVWALGKGCDEEALRVMKLMPKWKPGKQSGRAVRVKFNMPIVFALE